MHDTAFQIGVSFLQNYARTPQCRVVEIGALNVNGSLRDGCPEGADYLGVDYQQGEGVDLIVCPGQGLPLESESADVVISSSQMEHDQEFWNTLIELFRIVKTGGVIYINAPSNGSYHAYPLDNWRFFPDAGKAFVAWGRKNNYPMTLLESFTARRMGDKWNDFVCVLFKGEWNENKQIDYMSDRFACENVWRFGASEVLKAQALTEDQRIIEDLQKELARLKAEDHHLIEDLQEELARLKVEDQRTIGDLQNEISRLEAKIARKSKRAMLRRLRRFVASAFPPSYWRFWASSKL